MSAPAEPPPLFHGLTAEEQAVIAMFVEPITIPAGQVLFEEGVAGDAMYMVERGKIQILKRVDGAESLVLLTIGPGGAFGELALVDDAPRSSAAQAVGDTTLQRLTKMSFQSLVTTNAAIGVKILTNLVQMMAPRIRQVNQLLTVLCEIGQVLAGRPDDPGAALRAAIETLAKELRAERAYLYVVNPINNALELLASMGAPAGPASMPLAQPAGTLAALLKVASPRRMSAAEIKALAGNAPVQGWESGSNLIVPVGPAGRPAGYVIVGRTHPTMSDDDLNVAHTTCLQLGQYLERARSTQNEREQSQLKREYFRF